MLSFAITFWLARRARMESLTQSHRTLRFGVFELDLRAGALRKSGIRIKLQEQPLQILVLLLEHPGELVTRDELRHKLWSNDTYVDFDRRVNTAITKLRLALGDSADNPRFVETVPRRGYRFVAPVSSCDVEVSFPQADPDSSTTLARAPAAPALERQAELPSPPAGIGRRYQLAAALVLILASISIIYYAVASRRSVVRGTPVIPRRSVAVLGFKNLTGDAQHAWLSTALSDWLSVELGMGEHLRVIPEENVARMKLELGLPEVQSLGQDNLRRIRQNLGTDMIVIGSYANLESKSGESVRLDLHLQDTETGETLTTISETGTESQLLDLVSRTGAQLRDSLHIESVTPQEAAAVAVVLPVNADAARFYSQGLTKLRVYDALRARDLFQKTVAIEPDFALGHSALSAACARLGYDAAALEEAKKASELSSKLPRPERLLIEARYYEAGRNWQQAIDTYRTLFQFFPDNIDYGLALAAAEVAGGRGTNALETVALLHKLPPPLGDDPRVDLAEANAADSQGDLRMALASADRAAEKARSIGASLLRAHALTIRGLMLQGLGKLAEAGSAVQEAKGIFQAAGDKDEFARSEARAAQLVDLQGDFLTAKQMYETSLATFREIGDHERIAAELNNIGVELENLGDLNGARKNFQEALGTWSEVREQWGVAVAKANLAEILFDLGDLAGAQHLYQESFDVSQAIGNRDQAAFALSGLGRVLAESGQLSEAWRDEEKAVSMYAAIGQVHPDALVALSRLSLDLGKSEDARANAEKALQTAQAAGLRNDQPDAKAALIEALLAQGRVAEAKKACDEALASVGSKSVDQSKLILAIAAARVLAASNDVVSRTESAENLRQVIRQAKAAGFAPEEFGARLALAEVEMSLGEMASARGQLSVLEKAAGERGWQRIAHKAAEDLNRAQSAPRS